VRARSVRFSTLSSLPKREERAWASPSSTAYSRATAEKSRPRVKRDAARFFLFTYRWSNLLSKNPEILAESLSNLLQVAPKKQGPFPIRECLGLVTVPGIGRGMNLVYEIIIRIIGQNKINATVSCLLQGFSFEKPPFEEANGFGYGR
jgi:hypothetical protein